MKPIRTAAGRLSTGTGAVAGEFGRWLLPGNLRTSVSRLAGCSVGGFLASTVVERVPQAMGAAVAAGIVAAWRHGAPAEDDDGQEQPDVDDGQEPQEQPLPDREQLISALHHVGAPHAHLSALAAHLQETPARIRQALEEAGIPTAGGVRAGGRVSTGVRAGDFPALLPSPSDSPDGVVVAGQSDNNNTDGRVPYLSREGFWITPDPERPHGWNVAARP